jgi:hypothetical protein
MRALTLMTATCLVACATTACNPVFNWREVTVAPTPLSAMFPCKPEKASRTVVMAGQEVELHMRHCETGGIMVAVGHARIADPLLAGPLLAQWQTATLASMHASASTRSKWAMEHATTLPQAVSLDALGAGADGKPLALKGAWFARDKDVFAAMLYGPALDAEVVDAFFSGLQLQ